MRVGLLYGLGPEDDYVGALAQVEEADRLGLDTVLFEEHHGVRGAPCPGPLVAAAAARTSAIRVGSANRHLHLEYPVNCAEDFAVTDVVSRGRVILGVSPGERPEDFRAAGVPWDERDSRFREAVELVRTVWTQGPVQFVGDHYRFPLSAEGGPGWRREPAGGPYLDQWRRGQVVPQHLPVLPRPVQIPHPPIWVSAWDRDTIEWAAARGLTWMCSPLETGEEAAEKAAWYAGALASAGRDANEVGLAVAREVFLHEDGDRARELALGPLRAHVQAAAAEAAASGIEAARGLAAASGMGDDDLLAGVALVGTPLEVLDRVRALQGDAGFTHLVARVHLPGRSHLDCVGSIRLLASQLQTRLVA